MKLTVAFKSGENMTIVTYEGVTVPKSNDAEGVASFVLNSGAKLNISLANVYYYNLEEE